MDLRPLEEGVGRDHRLESRWIDEMIVPSIDLPRPRRTRRMAHREDQRAGESRISEETADEATLARSEGADTTKSSPRTTTVSFDILHLLSELLAKEPWRRPPVPRHRRRGSWSPRC